MRILFSKASGGTGSLLPQLHVAAGAAMAAVGKQGAMTAAVDCTGGHHHHQRRGYGNSTGNGRRKESVVVIMGATGTGKSKLSIDLATRFPGEVVNSDKIQVYRGLDITTNKISTADRRGVLHHLLGGIDPAAGELPASSFRSLGAEAISGIAARQRLPVVAGGSNSFVHALLADRYDPRWDPFLPVASGWDRRGRGRLRYRCCFLWVDVEEAALAEQLDRRVDEMVVGGMVDELEEYFAAEAAEGGPGRHPGLEKAIGVPEFREYFDRKRRANWPSPEAAYGAAVAAIKANTRQLADAQVRKIRRLGELWGCGVALRRVDATGTVAARLAGAGKEAEEAAWKRDVVGPSMAAVERFLSGPQQQLEEEAEDEECRLHHHQHQYEQRRLLAPPLSSSLG